MATTTPTDDSTIRLVDSIEETEQSTLDAIRRFVDTVNDAFPDIGEDGVRRRIIDSAFSMTEQLVGASNTLARNVLRAGRDAADEAPAD